MLIPYMPDPGACKSYYCSQSGKGSHDLPFYSSLGRQRGGGLGNVIYAAWRHAIPLLRKGFLNVGTHVFKGGIRFMHDVKGGHSVKQAIANRKRELKKYFSTQQGSGLVAKRKKKPVKRSASVGSTNVKPKKTKKKTIKKGSKKKSSKKKNSKTVNDVFA